MVTRDQTWTVTKGQVTATRLGIGLAQQRHVAWDAITEMTNIAKDGQHGSGQNGTANDLPSIGSETELQGAKKSCG